MTDLDSRIRDFDDLCDRFKCDRPGSLLAVTNFDKILYNRVDSHNKRNSRIGV